MNTPTHPLSYDSVILLVDIDGTLINSDDHLSQSISVLYRRYGVEFLPHEFFEIKRFPAPTHDGLIEQKETMLFGATWEDAYYYLRSKLNAGHNNRDPSLPPDPGADTFCREIVKHISTHPHNIDVRQDVIDMILSVQMQCDWQKIGFASAAVTNEVRMKADTNLIEVRRAGLSVDRLISADDVDFPKPAPQPYLKGYRMALSDLRERGYSGTKTLVVMLEDSPPGGKSAATAASIIHRNNPRHVPSCFYMPTTSRSLLKPELKTEEAPYFFVQQDIATLRMEIGRLLDGRAIYRAETTPRQSKPD